MNKKHLILFPLYLSPPLMCYVAGTYLAIGDNIKGGLLIVMSAVFFVAIYLRGHQLEERNEELDYLRPTPQWAKRLPYYTPDTLPPTAPPPVKFIEWPKEEKSGTRLKRLEWPGEPGDVPRTAEISSDLDAEVTKSAV